MALLCAGVFAEQKTNPFLSSRTKIQSYVSFEAVKHATPSMFHVNAAANKNQFKQSMKRNSIYCHPSWSTIVLFPWQESETHGSV